MKYKCATISSEQKSNESCWLDIQSGLHFLYVSDMLVKNKKMTNVRSRDIFGNQTSSRVNSGDIIKDF